MRSSQRRSWPWLVLLTSAVAAGSVAGSGAPRSNTAASSNVLAMDVFANGDVIDLLLFEETARGKALHHQRSVDGAKSWTNPTTIERAGRGIVDHHRGMDPQIAAAGDRIVVLWAMPGTSPWGEGPLATALSTNGGRTWVAGPSPSDDASGAGHAFLDLTVDRDGLVQAVWLDSRDGAQGLRGATSRDAGRSWGRTLSIDTRTCECCWNKAVSTKPGSFLVLYRDKDPRDMALAALEDRGGVWTRRGPVGTFNWAFDGCPHVGGGLAQTVDGTQNYLHAVVWTGADTAAGIHVLRSDDGGRAWSTPQRLGSPTAKHTDLASSGPAVAAVWDERGGGESVIVGAVSRDHGRTWGERLTLSRAGQTATHPLLASTARGFVAFWTEQTSGTSGLSRWQSAPLAGRGPAY